MEAFSLEEVKMPEAVENGLSIISSGLVFSLKLNQKLMQTIEGHGFIL
uniref:Uncharacterized protein n=1 Tax=Rhizophora mucronata TaxID=61149 RepID=A0A2P2PTX7_RHIMU